MMEALRKFDLVYLATPYSKYPAGIEAAFIEACRISGRLVLFGVSVYSPIAHTHPIAIHGGLDPMAHELWLPFDEAIMDKSDALCVAMMDGWKESRGIAYEIAVFRRARKPVFYLDPVNMAVDAE
jgi:hypothetical protein